MDDAIEEALGAYIGPATFDEIVQTLEGHSPGEWVATLSDPAGTVLWRKTGWSWDFVKADDSRGIFTIAKTEQPAGNPALFVDAPIVLLLHGDLPPTAACKLYAGGLVFNLGFGNYTDHTLKLVQWHGISHLLPSGDIAPGLGGFRADVEREHERGD